ncbi:dockerin type I domain-containing protein [Crateriforma spongiae]|uniref:dockerin type I domain-containing protein n=1 Tax=Crateriforma spongiae TaxID=2724528 RepID=UPI001446278D|nr:dockerin type I domain-containing protein [Crateriforma spongiae]
MSRRTNRNAKRRRTFETLEKRQLLFAPLEQTTLLGGLETLADTLDEVETHAQYAQQIPGLEKSAGQLSDFSEIVRDGLIEPLSSLLTSAAEVTPADVVGLLDGFQLSSGGTTTRIDSGSVSVEEIDDSSGASIELTATLQQLTTRSEMLSDFGEALWISWADDAPVVSVESLTEMTITLGVDRVGQEFYASLGEVTTSLSIDASGISGGIHIGPLGASVNNGSVLLNAELEADFGSQRITANQLQGASIDGLVSLAATGSFESEFDTGFAIGDYSGSETFVWNDSAVFDGTVELPELSETGDLIRMTRIDQEDLRGFFGLIGSKLDELLGSLDSSDASGLGDDFLPWLEGLKLPDLSGLADRFSEMVDGGLSDDEGRADFATFDDFRERLQMLTERETLLSYLPDTAELTFDFEVSASRNLAALDLTTDKSYGSLAGLNLDGTAGATGEFLLSGVFGVDLNALAEDSTPDDISDDDSWANHFFIDDVSISADVTAATESASASARLGFVGLSVGEIGVAADATVALELADDQQTDGRITFKRLSELVLTDPGALVQSSSLTGSADISLEDITAEGIPGLELDGGVITVGIDDLNDPTNFSLDVNEALRNVNSLSTVTIDQWVDMAGDVIEVLDTLTEQGKWNEELPGVGSSVNTLLDHAAKLQQALDNLLETDEATIQELGERLELLLEDALRLSPELLDVLLVWQNDTLEMSVEFSLEQQANLPLSLDLADLVAASTDDTSAFDLLGELVDVGAQTNIAALAALQANLVFGADVADVLSGTATAPTLYVGDTTGLEAEVAFGASDLNASIAMGPLGLFIRSGSITVDGDGDAATSDSAQLAAGLASKASGQYTLDEVRSISATDIETTFAAGASIVLPLYFPTESDPVGGSEVNQANAIIVGIGNIAGLFNEEDPQVTLQAPDVNSLIEDFDPVDEGLRVLADGIEALLIKVEGLLREQVLNRDLPMVGDKFESAADFLREVREDALPILRDDLQPGQLVEEVKQVLFDALGDVMRLADTNGDGKVDHQDISLLFDSLNQAVALDLMLGGSYEVGAGIDFDLGLPGVGLDLDGGVHASLDWALDVAVGVDRANGFYVDTTDVNELELGVLVTLPQAELTGTLGLFQISATDQGSRLQAEFDVDLKEPSGDGLLTFSELVSTAVSPADLIAAKLTGAADIDFALVAGTTFAALPELQADFVLDWNFDGSDLSGSLERVAIENIALDLGSFISGFAGDILGRVQAVLEPIEPIVDILTEPLPVANDLEFLVDKFAGETAPYDQVNLLDLASLLGNVDVQMIDAIVQIVDLASNIPTPVAGESVLIPLGEVVIVGASTAPGDVSNDDAAISEKDLHEELESFTGSEEQEQFAQESSAFLDQMTSITGGGFVFPIIDNPASLLGILLGQDATLFGYQTPKLSADFSMGVTVPITGPLAVEFVGGIGVSAQFAFGYDTRGLRNFIESRNPLELGDGFFVSDTENVDGTGADVDEVTLRGSLEAFATLTTGVASASVGGGIYATVGANLNDTSGDGKVRLQEFVDNLPLCAFDFAGSVSAGLRVKAQVLGAPFSKNIATVKLLEFGLSCSPAQSLALGEIDADGVYNLFVGDSADRREVGQGIIDEYVTFAPSLDADGNSVIEVSGFGITETISNVNGIRADAGDGNDSLVVLGSIDVPVEFHGGQGDDELVGGNLADILQGGGGDDLIQGNGGDDEIRGGAGTNTLEGGSGDDSITGGDRDDFIDAGSGDDAVNAGRGNDTILGGSGMDSLDAGDGNDVVYGGDDSDWIKAGSGDDEVYGGLGDDAIEADDGDDLVDAGAGADFVHGGRGIDRLKGGLGDDIIFGGFDADFIDGFDGNDILIGGNDATEDIRDDSNDIIRGDAGDDILIGDDGAVLDFDGTFHIIEVIGGSGDDYLEGGIGKDWAHGVGGNDEIYGGEGHDHLIGGDGDDEIFGEAGSDWLEGRDGVDRIFGHAGGDLIGGGRGADYIDGGDDEDQLYAHETGGGEPWFIGRKETEDDATEDVLLGRAGPDEIVGGLGNDTIFGGAGSDAILDRGGDDLIEGGLGNDYIETTMGHDTIFGQWGDDEFVVGTGSFARVDGQHGVKQPVASELPDDANNKMLVYQADIDLDFVTNKLADDVTDIDHLDASFATGFKMRIDRDAVEKITDSSNTLRLDFARDADVQLDGAWQEADGIDIDGVAYRQLTSQGVTLIVPDLKPQHRESDPNDVNGDGIVSALDALLVINHLNRQNESRSVILTPTEEQNLLDVSGDNWITALDALRVINELNRRSRASSEGEGESAFEFYGDEDLRKRKVHVEFETIEHRQLIDRL